MKKFKAVLCAALSVCILAVPLSSAVVFNAGAEDNIKSLQDKIDELEKYYSGKDWNFALYFSIIFLFSNIIAGKTFIVRQGA